IIRKKIKTLVNKTTSILNEYFKNKKILQCENIDFDHIEEKNGLREVIIWSKSKTIFTIRILDYPKRKQYYILLFLIVKASLLHLVDSTIHETEEPILDLLSLLWLRDVFKIKDKTRKIFEGHANYAFFKENQIHWGTLLAVCIVCNISFSEMLEYYIDYRRKPKTTREQSFELIKNWIYEKAYSEEYWISPIYLNNKLFNLVEVLGEQGYKNSSSSKIALKLNVHKNTIRDQFDQLTSKFTVIWKAFINLTKLNLFCYLLRINVNEKEFLEKITDYLIEIPYIKTIYIGNSPESNVIYSPNFEGPHFLSEQIYKQLESFQKKGIITNFYMELVKERTLCNTFTTRFQTPTIKYLQSLFRKRDQNLRKCSFYQSKFDYSIESLSNKQISLDYQLLYYLSFINAITLKKSTTHVKWNEYKEFLEYSNIAEHETQRMNKLLNHLKTKAIRKNLLSFHFYLRPIGRIKQNVTIIEFPFKNHIIPREFYNVLDRIRIFSLTGNIRTNDRFVLTIPGISQNHPICKEIDQLLEKSKIEAETYTVAPERRQSVPYHKLFDFEKGKWKLSYDRNYDK
ncbi:MAG: hypothetical protein ACTSO7_18840, partial [Candidatus Heimdallarchaeota archaeon]